MIPVVLSKVKAAFAVAVLAGLGALAVYVAGVDWSGLGPWGPAVGAFVAAGVAYMKSDKFLVGVFNRLEDYSRELESHADDGVGA